MKTVILSTTTNHNPGDEIIALGVKRLLSQAWGEDIQYVHYDRCPDLQEGQERCQRSDLVGNYLTRSNLELLAYADAVVLAGSPEWYGMPLYTLYHEIIATQPQIPLYALGVGLGDRWGLLSALDKAVLSRPETRIITRSRETTTWLQAYHIKSVALPCPAIMAYDLASSADRVKGTLVIAQRPGHGWHQVPETVLMGLDDVVDKADAILTVHADELLYFTKRYPGKEVLYANDTESFSVHTMGYNQTISTRLHGAVGALSLGIPSVSVAAHSDFRIRTALDMFQGLIPSLTSFADPMPAPVPNLRERVAEVKARVARGYMEVLR